MMDTETYEAMRRIKEAHVEAIMTSNKALSGNEIRIYRLAFEAGFRAADSYKEGKQAA